MRSILPVSASHTAVTFQVMLDRAAAVLKGSVNMNVQAVQIQLKLSDFISQDLG